MSGPRKVLSMGASYGSLLAVKLVAAGHAVKLCGASRPEDPRASKFVRDYVAWGAGSRASQYLVLGAKARAILDGRMAASVEDVRALAKPVLVHRVITNFRAESDNVTAEEVVGRLLEQVKS